MARRKTTHHRRHHRSIADPGRRHHRRRHHIGDGMGLADGWIPNMQMLGHGALSGGMQQLLRILTGAYLNPLVASLPAPWNFAIDELVADYGVFALARLLMKGQLQHDVQVGAIAIASTALTGMFIAPTINKMLGVSGYGTVGAQPLNGYGTAGAQPLNGYGTAGLSGGGRPAISSTGLQMMSGGRRSPMKGYRSQYAVS